MHRSNNFELFKKYRRFRMNIPSKQTRKIGDCSRLQMNPFCNLREKLSKGIDQC